MDSKINLEEKNFRQSFLNIIKSLDQIIFPYSSRDGLITNISNIIKKFMTGKNDFILFPIVKNQLPRWILWR